MAKINDVTRGEFESLLREVRQLRYATPMNNSSVSGGMRFYGGGTLRVENDGLEVIGSGTFTGTLYADGTVAFTGEFSQSGPSVFTGDTSLNGPTHINGATDITGATSITGNLDVDGTLDINGLATLNNDLTVQGGGKIKAGKVTVDPAFLSGSVKFDNGTYVAATPNGAQMVGGSGGASVSVSPTQADMGVASGATVTASTTQAGMGILGGGAVIVKSSGVFMEGVSTTTNPANLYIDPATNRVYRSTA